MRKVVVSEFLSLDGVMEEPKWTFPYWNDEIARFKHDELFGSEALLLGRVTYEGFAAAWPGRTDEGDYGDRINSMPKHVASTTLKEAEWNATTIKGDVAEAVSGLKDGSGQDLLVFGSGRLVQTLLRAGLVDEFRLLVYPIVLGKGQRLFGDGTDAKLTLTATQPFSSGVVALIYEPADATS